MKATISGGTKGVVKETVVDMEAAKEKWREEERLKELERNTPKPKKEDEEDIDPDTFFSNCTEIKNIRDAPDTVVIYWFDPARLIYKKHRAVDVKGVRKWSGNKHLVQFKLKDSNYWTITSDQEGEIRYNNLWLSEEDDELAIGLFKNKCFLKVIDMKKEMERFYNLFRSNWEFSDAEEESQ